MEKPSRRPKPDQLNKNFLLPGELVVTAVPGGGVPAPLGLGWPYWILDTDYESYASVYSCASFGLTGLYYEYAWLFTRDPVPSDEAVRNSNQYIFCSQRNE